MRRGLSGANHADPGACRIAAEVSRANGVDFKRALRVTEAILDEAVESIKTLASGEDWHRLAFKDRAAICTTVVRSLLDEKRLSDYLSGNRRRLI